jgi:excisionase family DNA binding protein
MTTKPRSPLAEDLLNGCEEIAEYLGWPLRHTQHVIAQGHLPVMKIGQRLHARKSQLDRRLTPDE